MSTLFTSYDNDGRILYVGRCENPEEQAADAGGFVAGIAYDGDEWYFDNGVATPRPNSPPIILTAPNVTANGQAEIRLLNVPAGAKVMLGDQEIIADGEDVILTTELIGRNKVSVDPFPAKPWKGEFNGKAP